MLLFGISIHAPRTGSDKWLTFISCKNFDFNPRSPHGERRYPWTSLTEAEIISIHAPRTGSDDLMDKRFKAAKKFQSTLPARGATTWGAKKYASQDDFNPRSPHGERRQRRRNDGGKQDFNPRSPHGERPARAVRRRLTGHFNPRSPHGERPAGSIQHILHRTISIHAPRTGSDSLLQQNGRTGRHFNPRSPHGERLPNEAIQKMP